MNKKCMCSHWNSRHLIWGNTLKRKCMFNECKCVDYKGGNDDKGIN